MNILMIFGKMKIKTNRRNETLSTCFNALQRLNLFNGEPHVWDKRITDSRITIVDFTNLNLNENDFLVVSEILLYSLFSNIENGGKAGSMMAVIIDEAHNYNLKDKGVISRKFLRESGKYGISTVIATQKIATTENV